MKSSGGGDDDDDDPDLFAYGRARGSDPDTSHTAAEPTSVGKLEAMFIAALKSHGPVLTTTEIANVYGMDRDSFSPRAVVLEEKGLIESAGKRLCANSAGKQRMMKAYRLKT